MELYISTSGAAFVAIATDISNAVHPSTVGACRSACNFCKAPFFYDVFYQHQSGRKKSTLTLCASLREIHQNAVTKTCKAAVTKTCEAAVTKHAKEA